MSLRARMRFSWPWFSLGICALLLFFTASNLNWHERQWTGIIKSDGVGYYAYLPAVFLYQDLSFQFLQDPTWEMPQRWNYFLKRANGEIVNRYYVGTAVVQSPFFLLGHLSAKLGFGPSNGYSPPYYLWVHWGCILWTLWGLYLLIPLLRGMGIEDRWIAWIIPFILMGTNLFYYVVEEPLMSHPYSFTLMIGTLLAFRHWGESKQLKWLLRLGIGMGLVILVRPINGLWALALPFLFPGERPLVDFGNLLREQWLPFLLAIGLGLLFLSLQFIIYYLQTGSPWVYSYGKVGFDFSQPHLLDFLFSYRKGFFVYTPMALLGLGGFYFWYRRKALTSLGIAGFLMLLCYVFSSWDFWFYGGGFSARVMIDFLVIWAILWGLLLQDFAAVSWRRVLLGAIVCLSLWSQFQTYQYRKGIILWDHMTKELYWERLFQTH